MGSSPSRLSRKSNKDFQSVMPFPAHGFEERNPIARRINSASELKSERRNVQLSTTSSASAFPEDRIPSQYQSRQLHKSSCNDMATIANEKGPEPASFDFKLTEGQTKRKLMSDYEEVCTQVTDFLFVGGEKVASSLSLLQQNDITYIVNCCNMVVPDYFKKNENMKYLTLNLVDGRQEDISWFLPEVINFIESGRLAGKKILIHCEKGISRSCSLIIAYIMWASGDSWKDAFDFVKSKRLICAPNTGFTCNLIEIDELLHGEARHQPLVFRCATHSSNDPTTVILKLCRSPDTRRLLPPSTSILDQGGVFIIRPSSSIKSQIYIWQGAFVTDSKVIQLTMSLCRQMIGSFLPGSRIEVIKAGAEPVDFIRLLIQDGAHDPRIHYKYSDLHRMTSGGRIPISPEVSTRRAVAVAVTGSGSGSGIASGSGNVNGNGIVSGSVEANRELDRDKIRIKQKQNLNISIVNITPESNSNSSNSSSRRRGDTNNITIDTTTTNNNYNGSGNGSSIISDSDSRRRSPTNETGGDNKVLKIERLLPLSSSSSLPTTEAPSTRSPSMNRTIPSLDLDLGLSRGQSGLDLGLPSPLPLARDSPSPAPLRTRESESSPPRGGEGVVLSSSTLSLKSSSSSLSLSLSLSVERPSAAATTTTTTVTPIVAVSRGDSNSNSNSNRSGGSAVGVGIGVGILSHMNQLQLALPTTYTSSSRSNRSSTSERRRSSSHTSNNDALDNGHSNDNNNDNNRYHDTPMSGNNDNDDIVMEMTSCEHMMSSQSAASSSGNNNNNNRNKPQLFKLSSMENGRNSSTNTSNTTPLSSSLSPLQWQGMGVYDDEDLEETAIMLLVCPEPPHFLWIGAAVDMNKIQTSTDDMDDILHNNNSDDCVMDCDATDNVVDVEDEDGVKSSSPIKRKIRNWLTSVDSRDIAGTMGSKHRNQIEEEKNLLVIMAGEEPDSWWTAFEAGF